MVEPEATAVGAPLLVIGSGSSPTQIVAAPSIEFVPVVESTRMVTLEELVQLAALETITLTTLLSTMV